MWKLKIAVWPIAIRLIGFRCWHEERAPLVTRYIKRSRGVYVTDQRRQLRDVRGVLKNTHAPVCSLVRPPDTKRSAKIEIRPRARQETRRPRSLLNYDVQKNITTRLCKLLFANNSPRTPTTGTTVHFSD